VGWKTCPGVCMLRDLCKYVCQVAPGNESLMTELPHHLKDWSREEEKIPQVELQNQHMLNLDAIATEFKYLAFWRRLAIERVRELHKEIDGPADDRTCRACAVDEYNYPEYPCETIKALKGV